MKVHGTSGCRYKAVPAGGLFDVALFGEDQWFNEDKLVVRDALDEERLAVYRGRMMKPDQYERFYNLLLEKNIQPVTEPEQYILMHVFPNVCEYVREDTAKIRASRRKTLIVGWRYLINTGENF